VPTPIMSAPMRSGFPTMPPVTEAQWAELTKAVLPVGDLGSADDPVVVAAPHPDDETLGVGGLIATMARAGRSVQVVTITDGEASHPGVAGLAARRANEQGRALAALGVARPALRLRFPDGAVPQHVGAITDALVAHLGPRTLLLAPWRGDGHPDHDAVGAAARAASIATGCRLLSYPVWLWQWATHAETSMLRLRRADLDEAARAAKAAAVACFESQIEERHGPPILTAPALVRAARPYEVVIEDPAGPDSAAGLRLVTSQPRLADRG